MKLKLGTDIECFIVGPSNNPINAFGYVEGTKDWPKEWKKGYFTSLDCVLMEYNTPPTESKEEFKQSIKDSIQHLETLLPENSGLKLSFFPAYEFPKSELQNPESLLFGCTPDYNAWTEQVNHPKSADETNWRSAGMHLHLDCLPDERTALIRNLDLFLTLPAMVLEPSNRRKELYGKAGAYRETRYGVELRTLSSWFQQEHYLDFIWDNSLKALEYTKKGFVADRSIESIINTNNVEEAQKFIKQFNLLENFNHEINQN